MFILLNVDLVILDDGADAAFLDVHALIPLYRYPKEYKIYIHILCQENSVAGR